MNLLPLFIPEFTWSSFFASLVLAFLYGAARAGWRDLQRRRELRQHELDREESSRQREAHLRFTGRRAPEVTELMRRNRDH